MHIDRNANVLWTKGGFVRGLELVNCSARPPALYATFAIYPYWAKSMQCCEAGVSFGGGTPKFKTMISHKTYRVALHLSSFLSL